MRSEIDTCTEAIEAGTIRKIRIRILPFLFLVYIICFLDRINIGFAALTMNKELAITSQQFGLLAGIFFFGYLLFGVPSNMLLHKVLTGYAAACGIAMINSLGNLGGFAGPYAIGLIKDKTWQPALGPCLCRNLHAGVGDILDPTAEKSSHPIELSFAGPRPDDGHPTGNAVRCRNLRLKPL